MIGIGRVCVKIAGRDAGKKCVVADVLDDNYVLIDGETRRRKCNIGHLEPLDKKVDINKNASHADVAKAFEALGYGMHTSKPKKAGMRPRRARKSKLAGPAPAAEAAPAAKVVQ
jgi:large subunit ribosomal protein L14e